MLHLREVLALQEGERIIRVMRRSLWTTFPGLALAGVCIALPFFLLFPLTRMGFVGAVIICALLALGFYLALKYVLLWDANMLVFTDRRFVLVRQVGLWSRHVIEAPLAGSHAALGSRSVFARLLRTGNVILSGHGLAGPVTVKGLSRPKSVIRAMHGLRDTQNAGFELREVS